MKPLSSDILNNYDAELLIKMSRLCCSVQIHSSLPSCGTVAFSADNMIICDVEALGLLL